MIAFYLIGTMFMVQSVGLMLLRPEDPKRAVSGYQGMGFVLIGEAIRLLSQ